MDNNWFNNLIDEKGNWIVPESGINNLKAVAPILYGEVLEEIKKRQEAAAGFEAPAETITTEENVSPCCGKPSDCGCLLGGEICSCTKDDDCCVEEDEDDDDDCFMEEDDDDNCCCCVEEDDEDEYDCSHPFPKISGFNFRVYKRDDETEKEYVARLKKAAADKDNHTEKTYAVDEVLMGNIKELVENHDGLNEEDIPSIVEIMQKNGFSAISAANKVFEEKAITFFYIPYKFGRKILKNFNGIVDKDVFLDELESAIERSKILDTPLAFDAINPIDRDARGVACAVTNMLCEKEVLEWRNLMMSRKGYNRIVRMFSEFFAQRMAGNLFNTPLDIGCTYPSSWDKC